MCLVVMKNWFIVATVSDGCIPAKPAGTPTCSYLKVPPPAGCTYLQVPANPPAGYLR